MSMSNSKSRIQAAQEHLPYHLDRLRVRERHRHKCHAAAALEERGLLQDEQQGMTFERKS